MYNLLKMFIQKMFGDKFFKVVQYYYWYNKIKNEKYFEPELEIAKNIFEPGDTVIDVGAHFGRYTIPCSRRVGKQGHIFAFEPIESTFKVLQRTVNKLKLQNITLLNCAISDRQHTQQMVIPVNKYGIELQSCSFLNNNKGLYTDIDNYHTQETTVETIDNLITNYNMQKIKLIKCDVEGAELFVIKGAINTIKKYSPIVLLEIVRNHTERYNYSPIDLLQFMMSLDYKIFVLSDGKLVETSSVTKNVINYFFVPNTVNVTSLS